MALQACGLQDTSFIILADEGSSLPVLAQVHRIVIKYVWLPSEVLPVMSVVTLSFVVFLVERTPFSLEVKHVEVSILLQEVDYSCFDVFHGVSKGAVLTVLALVNVLWELGTELGLVLFNVVETFDSVVSQDTLVLLNTLVCL